MRNEEKSAGVEDCEICGHTLDNGFCQGCENDKALCHCGAVDSWLPVYEDDYPIVSHWICRECGGEF